MPAIRPEPVDTSFETPAMADTGAMDYYKNVIYDTLYHSPVSGIYRISEMHQAKSDIVGQDTDMLSPEQATQKYGMDGELQFSEPIKESVAQLMQSRKQSELRREYLLESGSQGHWGRSISGFGVSMAAQALDPVNLASMFIPVVGEAKIAEGATLSAKLLGKGLISTEKLQRLVGNSKIGFTLAKGALEGSIGMSLVRPLDIIPTLQEQGHYDWKDEVKSFAMSAGLGAGIHFVVSSLHERFQALKEGLKNVDPATHEAAVMTAVSDLVKDEHITSPEKVISVDPNVVDHDIQGRYDDEEVSRTPSQEQMPTELASQFKPSDFDRYNQLVKEIKSAPLEERFKMSQEIENIKNKNGGMPPTQKISPKEIQQETQSRIQQIQESQSKIQPEKISETLLPSDKELGTQPVPTKPERLSDEEMRSEQEALVKEQMVDEENQLGDLEPHEQNILDSVEDKDLSTKTKAVSDGIACITKKAI